MKQSIQNALDDLETSAQYVEDSYTADMIQESVDTLREELEE